MCFKEGLKNFTIIFDYQSHKMIIMRKINDDYRKSNSGNSPFTLTEANCCVWLFHEILFKEETVLHDIADLYFAAHKNDSEEIENVLNYCIFFSNNGKIFRQKTY